MRANRQSRTERKNEVKMRDLMWTVAKSSSTNTIKRTFTQCLRNGIAMLFLYFNNIVGTNVGLPCANVKDMLCFVNGKGFVHSFSVYIVSFAFFFHPHFYVLSLFYSLCLLLPFSLSLSLSLFTSATPKIPWKNSHCLNLIRQTVTFDFRGGGGDERTRMRVWCSI